MTHVSKFLILLALVVGCATPSNDSSPKLGMSIPEVSWTKGETSTKAASETGEFKVQFETTKGNFTMLVHRDWSPRGAERFYQLIKNKYYDGAPFYRVMPGFMVQFGMNGDPKGTQYWDEPLLDEPVKQSNLAGLVSYAKSGPNTRSTQLFINYVDNSRLDGMGFSPFAEIVEGMENVSSINAEYLERPDQAKMAKYGNKYVFEEFPNIDYIVKATFVEDAADAAGPDTNSPETE